jgi:D-alanyl-D-alanine carboxypeptidase
MDKNVKGFKNTNNIYSRKSDGLFYSPFNLSIDKMEHLILFNFEKNPDKYYNTFELQKASDKTGLNCFLVIAYRNDGGADVYHQSGYPLASQDCLLNDANFTISPLEGAKFQVDNERMDVFFAFKDRYDREISVKATENRKPHKKPFFLFAPIGTLPKQPKTFPAYSLYGMSFAKRKHTDIEIRIENVIHQPDRFPLPVDSAKNYFTRYSEDTFNVDWNKNFEGQLQPLYPGEGDRTKQGDVIYELADNGGHREIKGMSATNNKHQIHIDFSPPVPDISCLRDDLNIKGAFAITTDGSAGSIRGQYQVKSRGHVTEMSIHPNKGWIPNEKRLILKLMFMIVKVFKEWPKSYLWHARIVSGASNHPVMKSGWKKKSNRIPVLMLATALALMLFSCNGDRQTTTNAKMEITRVLQARLDSLTDNHIVPGATLSVRFGDGTNFSLASGLADVENKITMKPDDIMLAGSVGKTYVAAVILKLYEQGLIDLDTKASFYLEKAEWFQKVQNAPDIKVEMLLNHTAGIPEYVYHKNLWEELKENPDKEWSVKERLGFINDEPPANRPGEGWAYADSHYLILGLIIEKVTGHTYYEMLDKLILGPCNLKHTIHSDRRSIPGLIPGYTDLTDQFHLPHKVLNDNKYAFNPQIEWTGGGLASTVSDLTLWASKLYGGSVLNPETLKLMLTPAPYKTTLFEDARYGLGSFIAETDGVTWYGHTGFSPGYITYVQYLPDFNIAIALQVNDDSSHDNFSLKEYFNTIKKVVLNQYYPTFEKQD